MLLHFTTDDGRAVSLNVTPGENVWVTAEGSGDPIGSLYLSREADTLTLGRFSEETQWWESKNDLPVTVAELPTGTLR